MEDENEQRSFRLEQSVREPNFFIVGAPKCGTTALDEYLKQHPDVFLPSRKEPQFFGSDLSSPTFVRDREGYLALFEQARDERRIGETSVWNLYSKQAAGEIAAFNPDAKIIAMLRNPLEMIPSLHNQYLYTGNEDIESLKEALEAEEDRKRGRRIPDTATFLQGLFYRETARYANQVQRYFDTFGRESVHVIVFDDLKEDPARVYSDTLRFLGVDPDLQADMRIVNPSKRVRSKMLRNLSKHPGRGTRRLAKTLVPRALRHTLIRTLDSYNTRYEPARPANTASLDRLREEFAPEVERLSQLLGRDLGGWCESGAS